MSQTTDITLSHGWHVGEDKRLQFVAYGNAAHTVCVDASGYALSWQLTRAPGLTPLITKTTGSGIAVSGAFATNPATNAQVIEVTVDDTDTQPAVDPLPAGTYYHELKRTDAGAEAVLAHGKVALRPSVHSS